MAQSRLNANALSHVTDLIGPDMTAVAVWADNLRNYPQYAWSSSLHFLNTPDGVCDFDYSRDCAKDRCVAGAIANYTSQLTGKLPGYNQTVRVLTLYIKAVAIHTYIFYLAFGLS